MGLALIYSALPTCLVVYVQKSDVHLINVFCVVILVKKCRLLCLAQVVFFYFVLHSSKIPLVLATKVTHLRSLMFRQPDGVNCVVKRVYYRNCPRTVWCSQWIMAVNCCVRIGLSLYLLTYIGDVRYRMLFI